MFQIYSKENCGYCIQSKNLLGRFGIDHEVKMLGEDFTLEWLESEVSSVTDGGVTLRTFPAIFHNGFYVGGFVDLQDYLIEKEIVE